MEKYGIELEELIRELLAKNPDMTREEAEKKAKEILEKDD